MDALTQIKNLIVKSNLSVSDEWDGTVVWQVIIGIPLSSTHFRFAMVKDNKPKFEQRFINEARKAFIKVLREGLDNE